MKWEYTTEQFLDLSEARLNAMGADGWEVCAIAPPGDGLAVLVFKRPKISLLENTAPKDLLSR